MSHQIEAVFKFHNIGQGLFYTGKIEGFDCVYDCGAAHRLKHANNLIRQYKNNDLKSRHLDFIVLSHLHFDHISGLNSLLVEKPTLSVDYVIMPYLLPVERLIISLWRSNLEDWFYQFLSNPVNYLLDHGVKHILLMRGGEDESERSDREFQERTSNPDNIEKHFKKVSFRESDSLKDEILSEENTMSRFFDNGFLTATTHKGEIRFETNVIEWLFRYYNYKVKDKQALENFQRLARQLNQTDNMIDIITDASKRNRLAQYYKSLQNNINDTSVLMYHRLNWINNSVDNPLTYQGHLLTGDIDLNGKVQQIRNDFSSDIIKTALCLVPHHGSAKNWNTSFMLSVPTTCTWVVSSGLNSQHPSFKVVYDIVSHGRQIVTCNEAMGVCSRPLLPHNYVYSAF